MLSGLKSMSNFCIVCTPRSGSYYLFEYMCKTFDLVEGNEWFGRNKEADLLNPAELNTKPVDIDWTKNEDLLTEKDIQRRRKHLENFPFPYCIKAMPLQLSNTPTQVDFDMEERAEIACEILSDFDLIWFQRQDKLSHFCFELTAMHCSQPDYPRNREYSTYNPEKRTTPPANSFTATKEDFENYMYREYFTDYVMEEFDVPTIWYEDFIEDQDSSLNELQEYFGLSGVYLQSNKKKIIQNPDYTKIFKNYKEIESWFR